MDHSLAFLLEQLQIIKEADVRDEQLDPEFVRVHAHLIVRACDEMIERTYSMAEGGIARCSGLARP